MKKFILLFTGLLSLFASISGSANSSSKLYRDYEFGMTKNEILKDVEVYDCSEEFEQGALCLNEQQFAGEYVDLGFRFINNNLVSVILFSEITTDNYMTFMGALNSRFQLTAMKSDYEEIDFLDQMKKHKEKQILKNITNFEQKALARIFHK
ncbi:hypothetical protein NX722_08380 [Endozoicomonas gorgoniicola]|uniref:Uncharacterized protein n=1 Tax=Endozoicomonas gorgoniicola TaxID=1234144 RepID=A0ABT3MTF4_9GAMM|nr:hypothetical protein [Endozoicomonas gorgoniicola]MCW7552661.1 hypothetical protein [Endozoicomonas gorgoniicola]